MKTHQIIIDPNVDEKTRSILEDYWQIENRKAVNKEVHVKLKYSINQFELHKIIRNNSHCLVTTTCIDCNKDFDRKATSVSDFQDNGGYKKRCERCDAEYKRIKIEEEAERSRVREEEQNKRRKQAEQLAVEKRKKFKQALDSKSWLKLNDDELEILCNIYQNHDYHSKNTSEYGIDKWEIQLVAERLESLGLLHIEKGIWNSPEYFEFDPLIKEYVLQIPVQKKLEPTNYKEVLSFSMVKKINKKSIKHPEYGGTFVLEKDVIIKAGVKYIYGGWILDDGSINLKFTPESHLNSVKQTSFEEEPKDMNDLEDNYSVPW